MAKATLKAPGIELMLNMLSGIDRTIAIHNGICTRCEGPAFEFRNELSEHEQTISGYCQDCQDEIFGK